MKNDFVTRQGETAILVNHKGKVVEFLIDTEDLALVSSISTTWTAVETNPGKIYARARHNGGKVYLHRWVMGVDDPTVLIDHRDGNTLDNRRSSNLRKATNSQNQINRKGATVRSKSGIRGVHPDKKSGKWHGVVGKDGKVHNAGFHDTIEEAEAAVIALRKKLYSGE